MVYIFAVIGMICWGISPLFAKVGLRNVDPLTGLSIRTLFTAIVVLIWMFLSGSIMELKNISLRTIFLLIFEAILATLIGDFAFFTALKKGSASIVMMIMACSPLITILCSVAFLGERIEMVKILGAGLIIVGLMLVI